MLDTELKKEIFVVESENIMAGEATNIAIIGAYLN